MQRSRFKSHDETERYKLLIIWNLEEIIKIKTINLCNIDHKNIWIVMKLISYTNAQGGILNRI